MARRQHVDERAAERLDVLDHAIGGIWIAYIGGAITLRQARRLEQSLRRAAGLTSLPGWARRTGPTQH